MDTSSVSVSADTLDRLPARAFTFLSAVGSIAVVRAALAARGYTLEVHQQGWALLDEVSGRVSMAPVVVEADPVVEAAFAEIDAWDEPTFAIARAALQHRFPAQCAYVFANDLQAVRGTGSVLAVLTFLRRLDGLERAPEREATREQDHAALATLASRGIGPKERAHMQSLLVRVQGGVAGAPADEKPAPKAKKPAKAPRDAKRELYVWYAEWSAVARAVIKQRSHLIRLGLASPRKSKPTAPKHRAQEPAPSPTPNAQRPSVAPPR